MSVAFAAIRPLRLLTTQMAQFDLCQFNQVPFLGGFCGEGWHSNEKTVRFWIPSPRVPKETDARCYAYTTPYTTMIPLCNVS